MPEPLSLPILEVSAASSGLVDELLRVEIEAWAAADRLPKPDAKELSRLVVG